MRLVWKFFAPLLLLSEIAWAFPEPTFIVQSDSFEQRQLNDYALGNFPGLLTETDLIQAYQRGEFEKRQTFEMVDQNYFYFGYRIDNRLSKAKYVFLWLPGNFENTRIYSLREGRLQEWTRYPLEKLDLFYTELPPGETSVFGHRKAGGNLKGQATGVTLYDFRTLTVALQLQSNIWSGLTGAVVIMAFYNIAMFMLFRKAYFFWYSLYSVASLTTFNTLIGTDTFDARFISLKVTFASLSLLMFFKTAMSITREDRVMNRLIFALMLGTLVICGYGAWSAQTTVTYAAPGFFIFILCGMSVVKYRQGYGPALYLVLGWSIFGLGLCLSVINFLFLGLESLGSVAIYGFALELAFFSMANSQKARHMERQALRENEHAFNQLKKVFYPHQIELMKGGAQLERTMPTGSGRACVISFDVIGSSRVDDPRAKNFLEDSLKNCLSLVSQHYDPVLMQSRAYRIKEMGDGFLCSVGFPFHAPLNQPVEDAAVQLALDFVAAFESTVLQYFGRPQVYCSIGIAVDRLEGYFPRTGAIEYDVFGRAIVLATRYESERKELFPMGFTGHIITLQDKVFQALSPDLQKPFTLVDLNSKQLSVRDDMQAKHLAYCIIQASKESEVA